MWTFMILRKEARIWRRVPGLPCADASLALSIPQRLIKPSPAHQNINDLPRRTHLAVQRARRLDTRPDPTRSEGAHVCD